MSASVSTPVLWNLTNLQAPASGITHALKLTVTANSTNPVGFAPQDFVNSIGLSFQAQSMRVNNSGNNVGVTVSETIYGWSQYVPAGETLVFNFPAIQTPQFEFSADSGTQNFTVDMFDFPAFAFASSNPNEATGTPIAPGSTAIPVVIEGGSLVSAAAYTDASVTATGASQTLVTANTARKYLLIGAPAAAPVWVNFSGGTAGPNLTGCFQIGAGGFYESNLWVPSNQVNVYCANAGAIIACTEG
jgi:hypothetical protein